MRSFAETNVSQWVEPGDLRSCSMRKSRRMKLVYIYHSGFAIEAEGFSLLFDYFKDSDLDPAKGYVHTRLLRREGPLYVLASHFHPDHFNPAVLRWQEQKADIHYLFSRDILKHKRAKAEDAIYLRKGEQYVDERLRVTACGSTDVGVSFLVELNGLKIFHAGDLNNWHWEEESTPQEIAQMEGDFKKELNDLAKLAPQLDLAMFPVDPRIGGDYMRGARQFLNRIPTRCFVPMHFWGQPQKIVPFGVYAESKGTRFVLLGELGDEFELRNAD